MYGVEAAATVRLIPMISQLEADPKRQQQDGLRRAAEAEKPEEDGQHTGQRTQEASAAAHTGHERKHDLDHAADQ